MKTLYEASNAVEAHMLLDVLKQEGIEAHIFGEALQGAIGEMPAAGLVRLVVDEPSYAAARAIIDRWEKAQPDPTPTPTPTRKVSSRSLGMQGFLLGIVLGVGVTYAAYKAPATSDGIDHNRDGLVDEKWTYSPNGSPLKLDVDRNLDKKIDMVARYNSRGIIESADADEDFDGLFETTQRFQDGNLQMTESDTDRDRLPDVRWRYSYGVLDTVEYLNPESGHPVRVEHYKLDRLQVADVDTDVDGKLDVRVKYNKLAEVASKESLPK